MKLTMRTRSLELTPEQRDQTIRRFRFALGRLGAAIREVHITLGDLNGPRGGLDKSCLVRVRLEGLAATTVLIEERDSELERAIDRAADRSARAVVRTLDRGRVHAPRPVLAE